MSKKHPSELKKANQTADIIELKKENSSAAKKTQVKTSVKNIKHLSRLSNERPKLFISHKHSDKDIALTLAELLSSRSGYRLDIHLSSAPEYQGPRIGRTLNAELRNALWKTDALILICTSADQDWSYCMWECGVATDPQSPDTKIYVLQCGTEIPAPFADTVLINARKEDDVRRFINAFMREPDFFPRRGKPFIDNVPDRAVEDAAASLFTELKEHLPLPDPKPTEIWHTWPFIRLQIKSDAINKAVENLKGQRASISAQKEQPWLLEELVDAALVVDYHARVPQIFGKNDFSDQIPLRALADISNEANGNYSWTHVSLEQILRGSQRNIMTVRWAPIVDFHSGSGYISILCEVKEEFSSARMIFDIYFVVIASPTAIPVAMVMIEIKKSWFYNIDKETPQSLRLGDLSARMEEEGRQRLPLMDSRRRTIYVVHKSLIDAFLLRSIQKIDKLPSIKISDLTLKDLLDDEFCSKLASNTVAYVGKSATIADAQQAMSQVAGCKDVFVTEDGQKDSETLGWLTDVTIVKGNLGHR